MEGSFQKSGDQIKINLQLIDAATDDHFWSDEFTGKWDSDDVFTIQTAVAENVVQNMEIEVSSEEIEVIQQAPTENKEAYMLYMQAEFQRSKFNQQASLNAIPLYEQAIALDPSFSQAYNGLSYIYINAGLIWGLFPEKEAMTKAKSYLQKSLAIAPSKRAAENLFSIEFYYNINFLYCEEKLNQISEQPSFQFGTADADYSMKVGRYQKAIEKTDAFIERFPNSSSAYAHKAKALVLAKRYKEANAILTAKDPLYKDDQFYLRESALAHFYLKNFDQSRGLTNILTTKFSDRAPVHIWLQAIHQHIDGNPKRAWELMDEILAKYDTQASGSPAWFMAMYHFFLEDPDNGFRWLHRSHEMQEVEMTWLREEILLIPYREDPRYTKIYDEMGWPDVPRG